MGGLDEIDALATRFRMAPLEFNTSPLYQALGRVVAEEGDLLALVADRRAGQQPTNLLFAAVHHLVLADADHPLRQFYRSVVGDAVRSPDAASPAFLDFCRQHRSELAELLKTRLVQTNVIKRAAALRLGLAVIASDGVVPSAHLLEVGTSSGMHLLHDRYRYLIGEFEFGAQDAPVTIRTEWRSPEAPPDLNVVPEMLSRTGIDLHPVDVLSAIDRRWLRALVWPENVGEAEELEFALDVVAGSPPKIIEGDIIEIASEVAERLPANEARVVFHAATLAHVPKERRPAFSLAVQSLGANAPLYVISLEGSAPPDLERPNTEPCHLLSVQSPTGEVCYVAWVEGHGDWMAAPVAPAR